MGHDENEKGFTVKDRRRFDSSGNRREDESSEASSGSSTAKAQSSSAVPPGASRGGAARKTEAGTPPRPKSESVRPSGPQHPTSAAASEEDLAEDSEAGGALDFSEFILSIATNAILHLGGDAGDGRISGRLNLPLAAQHIDIIAMLAQKTRGNLTRDESELLESLLYDLRMKYVSVAQAQGVGR